MKALIISLIFIGSIGAAEPLKVKSSKLAIKKTESGFGKLHLTPDQKRQISELKESKLNTKLLLKEVSALEMELRQKLPDNLTSESEIIAIYEEIQNKKYAEQLDRFKKLAKIRSILTPDQRAKYFEERERKR